MRCHRGQAQQWPLFHGNEFPIVVIMLPLLAPVEAFWRQHNRANFYYWAAWVSMPNTLAAFRRRVSKQVKCSSSCVASCKVRAAASCTLS